MAVGHAGPAMAGLPGQRLGEEGEEGEEAVEGEESEEGEEGEVGEEGEEGEEGEVGEEGEEGEVVAPELEAPVVVKVKEVAAPNTEAGEAENSVCTVASRSVAGTSSGAAGGVSHFE